MQLNVHVPKDREALLGELDRVAADLHRTKSQLVLDAVESLLKSLRKQLDLDLDEDIPVYDMGPMALVSRAAFYEERDDEKYAR